MKLSTQTDKETLAKHHLKEVTPKLTLGSVLRHKESHKSIELLREPPKTTRGDRKSKSKFDFIDKKEKDRLRVMKK
jgi:hypothetical protein